MKTGASSEGYLLYSPRGPLFKIKEGMAIISAPFYSPQILREANCSGSRGTVGNYQKDMQEALVTNASTLITILESRFAGKEILQYGDPAVLD